MKLSRELDYRIRYDVEHDLFHAQNIFNDEYIKPTFIEYVQNLEKENTKLQRACHKWFMRWREAKKDALYFDSSLQKQIEATLKLQQENAELKEKLKPENCLKLLAKDGYIKFTSEQLTKAKEIILRLYNAGRDVLMCRAEEKAYDNLSNAINDKSIEQFLREE